MLAAWVTLLNISDYFNFSERSDFADSDEELNEPLQREKLRDGCSLIREIEMFSPQKRFAIGVLALLAGFLVVQDASAQSNAQYEARLQAMRAARQRAQQPKSPTTQKAPARTQTNVRQTSYEQGFDYEAPPAPPANRPVARMARLPRQNQQSPQVRRTAPRQTVARRPVAQKQVSPRNYTPQHLRTAQVYDGQIVGGGAPIVQPPVVSTPYVSDTHVSGGGCACGNGTCSGCTSGGVYSDVVGDACGDDCGSGCGVGGCGLNGLLCGRCYSCGPLDVPCEERGGCPPGTWENCWLAGIGQILYEADYFVGAQAFKGPAFNVAGIGDPIHDCNFGLNAGFNLGIPLCKLSCGLFSGSFGLRSVQSSFNGSSITPDTRDQLFMTAGFYRRVDYGLQAGVAFDWLHEEWFTEIDIAQVRADVGWVYPSGTSFGLRVATNMTDDVTAGVINNTAVANLNSSTYEQIRFYYRRECQGGGFTELFAGAADDDRTALGIDCDMPIGERVAVQSGLAYFLAEETANVGGTDADGWNIYMGLSFRPRGLSWYKYYDRPMFNVADNGTFLIRR